jgi:endonuclease/exonuclease/phosphatase family metal-dependent hydrolase
LVLPIIFGASLLIATTLVYIFTNTWGYVGEFGIAFRGKFYLPYAVACLAMVLPLLLFSAKDSARVLPTVSSCGVAASAVVLALLVGVGLAVQVARMPDAGRQEKQLTILTYNLCMGSHKNGDRNLQDQLNLLRQIDADVIGLQESDTARPQTGNIDVSRYYARALGYQVYFGPTSISGTYGTAILSRYPLRRTRTIFTYSTVDEIGTAVAEIEVAGTTIVLINSHPAGNVAAHHAHTDAVLEVAESYDHVIAMGDFNCRQDSAYYGKLAGTLQDSWLACYPDAKGPRHPVIGTPPGRPTPVDELLDMTGRIDHVFLSAGFKVESSYFVPVPESRTDHPAYWTTVRWE